MIQVDLAPYVGADMAVMERDAAKMRDGGPTVLGSIKHGKGVQEITEMILSAWRAALGRPSLT